MDHPSEARSPAKLSVEKLAGPTKNNGEPIDFFNFFDFSLLFLDHRKKVEFPPNSKVEKVKKSGIASKAKKLKSDVKEDLLMEGTTKVNKKDDST